MCVCLLRIQKTEIFTGTLPEMGIPHEQTNKIQQLLTDSIDQLISMMDGYNFTSESEEIKERISNMVNWSYLFLINNTFDLYRLYRWGEDEKQVNILKKIPTFDKVCVLSYRRIPIIIY